MTVVYAAPAKTARMNAVVSGLTVGTSGTDFVLDNNNHFTLGQAIPLNSATLTHA